MLHCCRIALPLAQVPIIKAKISVPASNFPANTPAIIHPPSKPYSFSGQRPQPQLAPGHVCVDVDISLGTVNGADAVALVRRCVEAVAPVRPLVLVLKALLRQAGLNEVFTGGLSRCVAMRAACKVYSDPSCAKDTFDLFCSGVLPGGLLRVVIQCHLLEDFSRVHTCSAVGPCESMCSTMATQDVLTALSG